MQFMDTPLSLPKSPERDSFKFQSYCDFLDQKPLASEGDQVGKLGHITYKEAEIRRAEVTVQGHTAGQWD